MHVWHADLERASDDSPFRSVCPACKRGTLLVRRDQETFRLLNVDICTLCAQTVVYKDARIAHEPLQDVLPKPPPPPPLAPGDGAKVLDRIDSALGD